MNKTQIFKEWIDFHNREDKTLNGVSEEFAKENPNFEKDNESNKACWNCSRCSDCSVCSDCSDCSGCSRCSDCSVCSDCSDCYDCYDCYGCYGCYDCSGLQNAKPVESEANKIIVPKIENIHAKLVV